MQTIKFKGTDYVEVKERILYLANEKPFGYSVLTKAKYYQEDKMWVVKATLLVNGEKYNGHAQEIVGDGYINKTSALENAETSAVGRAFAMAGIGVIGSIASMDEINKSLNRHAYLDNKTQQPLTEKQQKEVFMSELKKVGITDRFMALTPKGMGEKFNEWLHMKPELKADYIGELKSQLTKQV